MMNNVLREIMRKEDLKEYYGLLDECCTACSEYMRGELFAPDIYANAWAGNVKVYLVCAAGSKEPEGICICTLELGILHVVALYLQVGAPSGLMKQVGFDLIELAKTLGSTEVRFKTQRPAGMKRALAEVGFAPACMEFSLVVE